MRRHDQRRFSKLVFAFIDGCGVAPPLHLVATGSNGSVIVSRYTNSGSAEVCASAEAGLVSPVMLTVVGMDGAGASAKIEITAARATMQ